MSSQRRTALGRGLSALIPSAPDPSESNRGTQTSKLPIDRIKTARTQPRTVFNENRLNELAASIEANGLIQPIVVRPAGAGQHIIIAGERRYRAAVRLGLHEVPVVVLDVDDAQAYELALIENIQREDLDPIEEAEAYRHLANTYGLTQQQIADRVGKDRVTVANALRILKLPEVIQADLTAGQLSAGHARAILLAPADQQRIQLAQEAIENGWSVRETERQARILRDGVPTDPPAAPVPELEDESVEEVLEAPRSSAASAVESQLRTALGAPVRLIDKNGKGRIEVRFHSYAELERLIDMIAGLEGM